MQEPDEKAGAKDIYAREQQAKRAIERARQKVTGEELHNVHFSNALPQKEEEEKHAGATDESDRFQCPH